MSLSSGNNNDCVTEIRLENYRKALGLGIPKPRISWQVKSDLEDWSQHAYEIEAKIRGKVYNSGRIESGDSIYVNWPFAPLESRDTVKLRVRVWNSLGDESAWSEYADFECGLLTVSDWSASFITPLSEPSVPEAGVYFRKEFTLSKEIKSARLYASALGLYESYINGIKTGDEVFTPGWTVYDTRLQYQSYDVTSTLRKGQNVIAAVLGEGWLRGRIGFEGGKRCIWGDTLGFIGQLEVTYEDGTNELIKSDNTWQSSTGGILSSGIYDGEVFDASAEQAGWNTEDFDADAWKGVRVLEKDLSVLTAPLGPPIRQVETLSVQEVITSPSGKTILDFGQNLVGRLRIKVKGSAGDVVTLKHAEVLEHGELGVRPLRLAKATDVYKLKGSGSEEWEPLFTFHGFRYAQVEGWPGRLNPADIIAVVIHSDMERTGWFECSDADITRLHENVRWGMKGNFLGVPTDCPQRDERLGWTGDLQVFSPTASFLYDSAGFLESWLADLAAEQSKIGGAVPPVVPNALGDTLSAAAWGDAATVVPWVLYERFGDIKILENQFDSMASWADFEARAAGEKFLWDSGFQFGDWLDPTAPPDEPGNAKTSKEIVATAYLFRSAKIVADAAELLGKTDAAAKYSELYKKVQRAFVDEYMTAAGRMMSDAHTAYALAIAFDLCETERQRIHAGERLADLVMVGGYQIQTGFVGTPIICDALCSTGHYKEAFKLLTNTENPGWLYPVRMGATTIWERWDSMLPDGSINPGEMTSFNHYAFGAVADWMHRYIGGIAPLSPGYKKIRMAPVPGGGITSCVTRFSSLYGEIQVSWKLQDELFSMDISIPPNCSAEVKLPGSDEVKTYGSGTYSLECSYADPYPTRALNITDSLGDVIADKAALGVLIGTLDALNAPGFLKGILFNERKMKLKDFLKILPEPEQAEKMLTEGFEKVFQGNSGRYYVYID